MHNLQSQATLPEGSTEELYPYTNPRNMNIQKFKVALSFLVIGTRSYGSKSTIHWSLSFNDQDNLRDVLSRELKSDAQFMKETIERVGMDSKNLIPTIDTVLRCLQKPKHENLPASFLEELEKSRRMPSGAGPTDILKKSVTFFIKCSGFLPLMTFRHLITCCNIHDKPYQTLHLLQRAVRRAPYLWKER